MILVLKSSLRVKELPLRRRFFRREWKGSAGAENGVLRRSREDLQPPEARSAVMYCGQRLWESERIWPKTTPIILLKESDKDWTPTSSKSISSESHSNNRKKRTMKNSGKKGVSEAVNNFQRIWSNEDEIAVLEGMLEYASARNISPSVDYNAFYIFVKDKLQVEVSKNQLKNKVKNLKS
uniref:Mediator-associated protein 1-like n=1 Tax=Nicotiana tabacum TaxID=4097 RepID=A0A1S3Z4M8_TOBAC|nr:PREDICTED: mediator-associated protein 1-like [Nicotiana tabacum]